VEKNLFYRDERRAATALVPGGESRRAGIMGRQRACLDAGMTAELRYLVAAADTEEPASAAAASVQGEVTVGGVQ
jgi:hypothetical protein